MVEQHFFVESFIFRSFLNYKIGRTLDQKRPFVPVKLFGFASPADTINRQIESFLMPSLPFTTNTTTAPESLSLSLSLARLRLLIFALLICLRLFRVTGSGASLFLFFILSKQSICNTVWWPMNSFASDFLFDNLLRFDSIAILFCLLIELNLFLVDSISLIDFSGRTNLISC